MGTTAVSKPQLGSCEIKAVPNIHPRLQGYAKKPNYRFVVWHIVFGGQSSIPKAKHEWLQIELGPNVQLVEGRLLFVIESEGNGPFLIHIAKGIVDAAISQIKTNPTLCRKF